MTTTHVETTALSPVLKAKASEAVQEKLQKIGTKPKLDTRKRVEPNSSRKASKINSKEISQKTLKNNGKSTRNKHAIHPARDIA